MEKTSIAETLTLMANLKNRLTEAQNEEQSIRDEISQLLREFVAATGTSSFEHAGKWYQVRNRINGAYLCEMDVKPGSWLVKDKSL